MVDEQVQLCAKRLLVQFPVCEMHCILVGDAQVTHILGHKKLRMLAERGVGP